MSHSGSPVARVDAVLSGGRAATGEPAREARLVSPRDGSTPVGGLPRALLLMEQLIAAIELRDSSDPDAPPWEADAEIRRLEHELSSVLRATMGWRMQRHDPPDEVVRDWD